MAGVEGTSSGEPRVVGEWTEFFSDEGVPYYFNARTSESRWEAPEGFGAAPAAPAGPPPVPPPRQNGVAAEAAAARDPAASAPVAGTVAAHAAALMAALRRDAGGPSPRTPPATEALRPPALRGLDGKASSSSNAPSPVAATAAGPRGTADDGVLLMSRQSSSAGVFGGGGGASQRAPSIGMLPLAPPTLASRQSSESRYSTADEATPSHTPRAPGGPLPVVASSTNLLDEPRIDDMPPKGEVGRDPDAVRTRRRFSNAGVEDESGTPYKVILGTRLMICLVAVTLVWCTSLRISAGIAALFVESPSSQVVVDSWRVVVDVGAQEREAHVDCARLQTDQCKAALNRTVALMVAASDAARRRNRFTATAADLQAVDCNAWMVRTFSNTQKWVKLDPVSNRLQYNANCSAEERATLQNLVGDIGEVKSNSFALSTDYVRQTSALFDNAASSIANRTEYDRNYIATKLGLTRLKAIEISGIPVPFQLSIPGLFPGLSLAIDRLVACLALTGSPCPRPTLVSQFRAVQEAFNATYHELNELARTNYERAVDYTNRVVAKMAEIGAFFDRLRGVAEGLAGLGISVSSIPGLGGLDVPLSFSAIPLPSTSVPIDVFFNANLPSFRADFNSVFTAFQADVNLQMLTLGLSINTSIGDLPTMFDDYNPPPIVLGREEHETQSDEFIEKSKATLGAQESDGLPTDSNVTRVAERSQLSSVELSRSVDFNFQPFSGDVKVNTFLEAFDSLVWFFLFVDYMFRVYQSVRIFVKYWTKSAVGLPVVDVRRTGSAKSEDSLSASQKLAVCLTSTKTLAITLIVLGIVLLAGLIQIYAPVYSSYKKGCVETTNGTALTRNSFSLTYNLAASKGDEELQRRIRQYDAQRVEFCGLYGDASTTEFDQQVQRLRNANVSHADASGKMALFRKCVNMSSFPDDATFFEQVGEQSPRITLASAQSCLAPPMSSYVLENAIFNCTQMPPCSPTCSGPNVPLLARSTHISSCRTEAIVHSTVFNVMAAFLVYVCINVSRVLLMGAVSRLFWRSLTPYGFVFMAHCSRTGKTQKELKPSVAKELYESLRRYEKVAVAMIALAIFAHLPYIIVLSVLPRPAQIAAFPAEGA